MRKLLAPLAVLVMLAALALGSATHAPAAHADAYPCQETTWVAYWGSIQSEGWGLMASGLNALVDPSRSDLYCGQVQTLGFFQLESGCNHFHGITQDFNTGGTASYFNIYHCTLTNYHLSGAMQSLACNAGDQIFAQSWDDQGDFVFSPIITC